MLKKAAEKSLKWHLAIFCLSVIIFGIISAAFAIRYNPKNKVHINYAQYSYEPYYYQFQNHKNEAHYALKASLEEGDKVVLFGSSELTGDRNRFMGFKFFNKPPFGQRLTAFGHAGHQTLAITTELASAINEKALINGKIIILLSPIWFAEGEGMNRPLWKKEIASPLIVSRIRENSFVPEGVKSDILKEFSESKWNMTLDSFLVRFVDEEILRGLNTAKPNSSLKGVNPPWSGYALEAVKFEQAICQNEYGINTDFYNTYIRQLKEQGKLPLKIPLAPAFDKNGEIKDFFLLLEILDRFKIKPLFVFLPLNQKIYDNLPTLDPTMAYLRNELTRKNYKYLDLWSRPYEQGVLTDVMHTGALGWVYIDRFIYESFNLAN